MLCRTRAGKQKKNTGDAKKGVSGDWNMSF